MKQSSYHICTLLVLLLLLLLCCFNICHAAVIESKCIFEKIMKQNGGRPVEIIKELQKIKQGSWKAYTAVAISNNWAPLRIIISDKDLEDNSKYCNETGVERPTFDGSTTICTEEDIITLEKMNAIKNIIIPAAVKLHTERLLVQPQRNPLIIPSFDSMPICKQFTVPSDHRSPGVRDADMIIYVAAGPTNENAVWAISCATSNNNNNNNNRPIAAVLNIGLLDINYIRLFTRLVAHQIAHAMGFTYTVMKTLNMVTNISNVRGKEHVTVVNSPKTKEKAQAHYNCENIKGMELEDDNDNDNSMSFSHWKRRNAKDELMSSDVGLGAHLYTALTMAAFEDMGFFRAQWGMEESMKWGQNAGCNLLNEKCMKENITNYPEMFCNETSSIKMRCTSDRLAYGECQLKIYPESLPEIYQYFTDSKIGGTDWELTDYCPIRDPLNFVCNGGIVELNNVDVFGNNSWCLDGDSLIGKRQSEESETELGGVCVAVSCNKSVLKVRYAGDSNWYECPENGNLTPSETSSLLFTSGRILCPKYEEVCTISPNGSSLIIFNGNKDGIMSFTVLIYPILLLLIYFVIIFV